ncbi:radical SAM protein [Candidatus Woesearchaeota archaeon]|nr:radical SAM protein [Candidatus Woesearchaeota archaeon]
MDEKLIGKAIEVYNANFSSRTWFGRCIFLSWYCDIGTCEFCFRSTVKHKIRHASSAKRSKESILCDAIIGKNLGWRIEFLTGGYRIFSFEDQIEICRLVSEIYGHKIWINLGTVGKDELQKLQPYVEGVCASIECVDPDLHNRICPDKPIEPYSKMLKQAKEMGFKTSCTIVVGLGETHEDFELLAEFISEHELDRITFYALKPIQGTRFTESPLPDEYAWWVAMTRVRFPLLEIMAGLTPKRAEEYAGLLLRAGANGLTKYPAVKRFGSAQAHEVERQIKESGRKFEGSLTELPDVDWDMEVERLGLDEELKEKVKGKLKEYVEGMKRGSV